MVRPAAGCALLASPEELPGCGGNVDPNKLGFCSCALLELNAGTEVIPIPVLAVGGGPAGVVDVKKDNSGFGLLFGVKVSAWLDEVLNVLDFPKKPPPPALLGPPKIPVGWVWPGTIDSMVLFGVDNAAKPMEGALVPDGRLPPEPVCPDPDAPKLKLLELGLSPTPNRVLPEVLAFPAVPNREDPDVAGMLVKGLGSVDPKILPDVGV